MEYYSGPLRMDSKKNTLVLAVGTNVFYFGRIVNRVTCTIKINLAQLQAGYLLFELFGLQPVQNVR